MKGKYFYIASYARVVYCHEDSDGGLILSGLCRFMDDALKATTRQSISRGLMMMLEPKEIDPTKLSEYDFLESVGSHMVKDLRYYRTRTETILNTTYIKEAKQLSSIYRGHNLTHYEEPI